MKRALITGITGMVGSHLADFILENTDWEVHGMLRWADSTKNIDHLATRVNSKDRVYLHNADLNDFASLITLVNKVKPDYVFHLAAQSYPKTSFDSPLETLQTNVIGTCALLESIRVSKLNSNEVIVHVCASSEVFGRVPFEKLPIHEDVNFHPASPYAISKVGTDLLGRFYAEAYGMKVMTTRMFTHTGPRRGDVFAESSFAKQIAMIESGKIPPVLKVGNLDSLRTWSDVRDAVRAYYMLVTCNPIGGEYYNIGGSYTCTVREMLSYLLSLSTVKDIKVEVEEERLRPIDADLQIPDTSKFRNHTGWEPQIKFETTMLNLLNYWRDRVRSEENFIVR